MCSSLPMGNAARLTASSSPSRIFPGSSKKRQSVMVSPRGKSMKVAGSNPAPGAPLSVLMWL